MDIGVAAVAISTVIFMFYTGLLFDPALFRQQAGRHNWREFGSLALVNYLVIPAAVLCMVWFYSFPPIVSMVLLTLAMFPCAPLVPALVGMSGESPDWSLFAFLTLSLLNLALAPVLVAVLAMPWAAGSVAQLGDGGNAALSRYALSVYGPIALGALIRQLAPPRLPSVMSLLRRVLAPMMLTVFVLFMYSHRDEILGIGWRAVGALLFFEVICVVAALLVVFSSAKNHFSNILITVFRNFTMGIAFMAVVFPHTPALSYMMAFTSIVLAGVIAWIGINKFLARNLTAV